jgi:hypothetical protein
MSVVPTSVPTVTPIWLAAGVTDMRKGFTGLSALVQHALASNPFCGHIFVFRGRRGDLLKVEGDYLRIPSANRRPYLGQQVECLRRIIIDRKPRGDADATAQRLTHLRVRPSALQPTGTRSI